MPDLDHAALLRRAIAESRKARDEGNHPFASILVGPDGEVLMTQHNAYHARPRHDRPCRARPDDPRLDDLSGTTS